MTGYRFIASLTLLCCGLAGCATVMQTSKLPDGVTLREVAKVDPGRPFAVSRDGSIAAVSEKAIALIDPAGAVRKIAGGAPNALVYSPSGEKLAAALPAQKGTLLRILDRHGKVLAEATLAEPVTALAWRSEGELLATGLSIKRFSFGSDLAAHLYAWDGTSAPVATRIDSTTVRPKVGQLPEETLLRTLQLAVSPYGDEIAYTVLSDPPMFVPYLKIFTRHLDTGIQHQVEKTSMGSGAPLYGADGDSLIVGDSHALTRKLALPDGRETDAWPAAGNNAALSPSGAYLLLDGRLFQDGREIVSFPAQARGVFVPDGSGLVVSYEDKIYLVSGVADEPRPLRPGDRERLLELRRFRAQGLISETEYRAEKGKGTAR
jgi:hypothetical protein